MPPDPQDGLAWDDSGIFLSARWAREPSLEDIESISRRQLGLSRQPPCTVTFYDHSVFAKLYLIVCDSRSLLMKVILPVYPSHNTRGEVATLRWVQEHTNIPVHNVVAFDDSNDNSIGFEWILMDFVPGVPAYRRWRTMSWEQKLSLTKRVAELQVQLFRNGAPGSPFKRIGTLVRETGTDIAEASTRVAPGKLVSHDFFLRSRLKYDVPRGPFRSSHEWLRSLIDLMLLEQSQILKTTGDEDEKEDAQQILGVAQRLLSFLPKVFPKDQDDQVPTALYHDRLSLHNILVDEYGAISAIMDWDCVSAMPIWFTTKMPDFLVGERRREEEPIRETYGDETPEESAERHDDGDQDELDNEGKNGLYWIHLMDYETTKLWKVYGARLRELWPDWPLQESRMELDFCEAVLQCSCSISVTPVNSWLDSLEGGNPMSLEDANLPEMYRSGKLPGYRKPEDGSWDFWNTPLQR